MSYTHTVDGYKIDVDYEYEKYYLKDYLAGKTVEMDVNWNKAVAPTKMVRFRWQNDRGDWEQLVVDRAELQTLMFLLAPSEDESRYLKGRATQLKRQRHEFRVKATRDIKRGDDVVINKYIS